MTNDKWRDNTKNLTEPYNGHFENLTEPYSKENKTLQNLTQHLCQVVVTLSAVHVFYGRFLPATVHLAPDFYVTMS